MADTTKTAADQSFFVFVKDTNTGKIRRMAIPGDVQIGLQGNPAELQLLGRLSLAATDYSIVSENQGILYVKNDDTIISVSLFNTPALGRITLYLPANPRNGQLHFIKDMTGTAGSVPIDIVPSPGALIDQVASKTLTAPFGSIALYWFGDHWRILVSGFGSVGVTSGTFATRPSPAETGRVFVPTDGVGTGFIDNGVAWQPFGPTWILTKPPVSASWTNISLGTSQFINDTDSLFLSASAGAAPDLKVATLAAPATPYKITALICPLLTFGTNSPSSCGIGWRDSNTSRLAMFFISLSLTTGNRIVYNKFNTPTSFNSSYFDALGFFSPFIWMRLENDGTRRRIGYSTDGKHFLFFSSTVSTDFFTVSPNQVCIFVDSESAMSVLSWKVE